MVENPDAARVVHSHTYRLAESLVEVTETLDKWTTADLIAAMEKRGMKIVDAPPDKDARIRRISVEFPFLVELPPDMEQTLLAVVEGICASYEIDHPTEMLGVLYSGRSEGALGDRRTYEVRLERWPNHKMVSAPTLEKVVASFRALLSPMEVISPELLESLLQELHKAYAIGHRDGTGSKAASDLCNLLRYELQVGKENPNRRQYGLLITLMHLVRKTEDNRIVIAAGDLKGLMTAQGSIEVVKGMNDETIISYTNYGSNVPSVKSGG